MGALHMATRLPAGFVIPEELTRMLMWIDENGWVCRGPGSGDLYWTPYPEDDRSGSLAEFGLAPAEEVVSHASGWLGTVDPAIYERLFPFVQTGADGSYAAFWLDAGVQRIVHMGSGSGSTLACVLGTPLDVLRLLAIGYDEIGSAGTRRGRRRRARTTPGMVGSRSIRRTANGSVARSA